MSDDLDVVVDGLTRVVVRACRALAEAGQPRQAGRLAADAWAVVRHTHQRQALHLDGAMHHIARVEQQAEAATSVAPPFTANLVRKETTMSVDSGSERVLDVRTEEPKRRHELIFETFTELPAGQTYVLVNDHDPKPLRYQFDAENAGEFSWDYLEQGPEVWRVRIGRIADPAAPASP